MNKKNYFLDSHNKNQLFLSQPYPSSFQSEQQQPKNQFQILTLSNIDVNKFGERKKFKLSHMKRIMNDLFKKQQYDTMNEKNLTVLQKQQIIDKFMERQQFKARQNKILKQMQQFCHFGSIKPNFH